MLTAHKLSAALPPAVLTAPRFEELIEGMVDILRITPAAGTLNIGPTPIINRHVDPTLIPAATRTSYESTPISTAMLILHWFQP